jgi:hypothetical protein
MIVSLSGGEPRPLTPILAGRTLDWISANELLAISSDGDHALWINTGGGEPRERAVVRCPLGVWTASLGQLLCSFNGSAQVINLQTDINHEVRIVQSDGMRGGPLAGSEFRLIDGRYPSSSVLTGCSRARAMIRRRTLPSGPSPWSQEFVVKRSARHNSMSPPTARWFTRRGLMRASVGWSVTRRAPRLSHSPSARRIFTATT